MVKPIAQTIKQKLNLWSLDLLVLGFASSVVGRSFAVIRFFYFVTWLGHFDSSYLIDSGIGIVS